MEREDLEQRIRETLRERGEDVEPTPWLWQHVDRRVRARRLARRWSWTVAASFAALAAAVVVPMVIEAQQPEIAPVDGAPPDREGGEVGPDEPGATPRADAGNDTLPQAPFSDLVGGPALEVDGVRLRLRTEAGTRTLAELDAGERWRSVAVRPTSDAADITAVGVVEHGGDLGLRHLEIVDGSLRGHEPIDDPAGWSADAGDAGATEVRWSPDGGALAWLVQDREAVLHTLDWQEGAGPDVDHAAWTLDVPSGAVGTLRLQDWQGSGDGPDGRLALVTTTGEHGAWELSLQRRATGLAVAGPPQPLEDDDGVVRATSTVGRVLDEQTLAWQTAAVDGDRRSLPAEIDPEATLSLGPTVAGAAPLRAGDDWWLITPDAVAPWPGSPDAVALVP